MNYYAHCVSDARWLGDTFYQLKGESITIDLQCLNNEWSTYLVKNLSDKETLDKIALQFFAECTRYVESSIALVLFTPSFLNKHKLKEPENNDFTKKKPFCLQHYNVRSANSCLNVQCVLDVGQDLFFAFNNSDTNLDLVIVFYSLLQISSIIKRYQDEFKMIINGNNDKIGKMITIFSSIKDDELLEILNSLLKKK